MPFVRSTPQTNNVLTLATTADQEKKITCRQPKGRWPRLIRALANIANSISFVHGSKNKLLVDGKRNSQTQTGPVEILEREWKKGSSKFRSGLLSIWVCLV
jgi:hypothetical protein